MRAFGAIVIAIWASWFSGQPAHAAGGRVALVIGNSSYQNVARLSNPINDAAVIAAMLRKAGFDSVDYLEIRDAETLRPPTSRDRLRILAAVRITGTRLIDNMAV